jgi:protein SCO1
VSRSYGVGLQIVFGTILISSAVCLYGASRVSQAPRAAHDLGPSSPSIGSFQLTERSGQTVTEDNLADRVAIASFIFTRCPLSCPRISGVMQGLQSKLSGTEVQLVSFSVDPEHDTPDILRTYAERFGASPERWWFLTGPRSTIYGLIRDRFKLSLMEAPAPSGPETETEAIVHSDRLALIDHGRIVGLFESNDPDAVDSLVVQARRRALPVWVAWLPTVNASLNGLSANLLLAGWILIRRYRTTAEARSSANGSGAPLGIWDEPLVKGHIACMVAAVITSAVFLVCYLVYHYRAGSMPFPQGGYLRVAYLSILLSHTLLATSSVPLILITVRRGWQGDLGRHTRIAGVTFPIWLYVAVTGVVIYLMLYHLPALGSGSSPLP